MVEHDSHFRVVPTSTVSIHFTTHSYMNHDIVFFLGRYGDLDSSVISYGPCQTPTLGFCVQRHDEIQTFKPETFWVLRVTASTEEGRELPLEWKRGRVFEKDIANMFLAGIKEIKEAK